MYQSKGLAWTSFEKIIKENQELQQKTSLQPICPNMDSDVCSLKSFLTPACSP